MNDEMNNAFDGENMEETENALSEGDLIELIDDSGKKTAFIFVDALEYEDSVYLALAVRKRMMLFSSLKSIRTKMGMTFILHRMNPWKMFFSIGLRSFGKMTTDLKSSGNPPLFCVMTDLF